MHANTGTASILAVVQATSGEYPLHEIVRQELSTLCEQGMNLDWLAPTGLPKDLLAASEKAACAALVVVQEPVDLQPSAEAAAAVGAARAMGVPLLILAPAEFEEQDHGLHPGPTGARLWPLADASYSQVVKYPTRMTPAAAWERFASDLCSARVLKTVSARRSAVRSQLRSLSEQIVSHSELLSVSPQALLLTQLVCELIQVDVHRIELQNSRSDHPLELTIPARLYPEMLSFFLTGAPFEIHAIADPANEELKWHEASSVRELTRVARRTFLLYRDHVRKFGLEEALAPIQRAASSGQDVWVACVEGDKDRVLLRNDHLFGNNRFWITDGLLGGWADSGGRRIKLLSYPPAAQNAVYQDERDTIATFTRGEVPEGAGDIRIAAVPLDRVGDVTELASWLYSAVLDDRQFESIWAYGDRLSYARAYDANIVQVTPRYYPLLDAFAGCCRRALLTLATAYSPTAHDHDLRVLELGYGTGTFTKRLGRVCRDVNELLRGPLDLSSRRDVQLEGWDSNPHMYEIAKLRVHDDVGGLRRPGEEGAGAIIPVLKHRPFEEKEESRKAYAATIDNRRFDLIVGSLVAHYFVDCDPYRKVRETAEGLRKFYDFLSAVGSLMRDTSGRMAQFLDVFFPDAEADQRAETEEWRLAVEAELRVWSDRPAQLVEQYFQASMQQTLAPTMSSVNAVAAKAGFATAWEQPVPGLPFRVLTLTQQSS